MYATEVKENNKATIFTTSGSVLYSKISIVWHFKTKGRGAYYTRVRNIYRKLRQIHSAV